MDAKELESRLRKQIALATKETAVQEAVLLGTILACEFYAREYAVSELRNLKEKALWHTHGSEQDTYVSEDDIDEAIAALRGGGEENRGQD